MKIRLLITIILLAAISNGFSQAVITYKSPDTLLIQKPIIPIAPTMTGGKFTNFTINPALPTGLILNASNGSISGTPQSLSPGKSYVVTAKTGNSTGTATLVLSVVPQEPNFKYNKFDSLIVGRAIDSIVPIHTGGPVLEYGITPSLPAGIYLDKHTGEIKGAPQSPATPEIYNISGKNNALTFTTTLKFSVVPDTPKIKYPLDITLLKGVTVPFKPKSETLRLRDAQLHYQAASESIPQLKPIVKGAPPTNFSISSDLPKGLVFDSRTGEIRGTPDTIMSKTFTITANYPNAPKSEVVTKVNVIPDPSVPKDPPSIRFVGEGSILQSLKDGSKLPANTGIGIIFREPSGLGYGIIHNIEVDFSINVASTADTIKTALATQDGSVLNRSDFGNSVLLPLNSGQAFRFALTTYVSEKGEKGNYQRNAKPKPLGGVISGFKIAVVGSNRNWEFGTDEEDRQLAKASFVSTYAGVFYDFLSRNDLTNFGKNASATIGFGYSARYILGDIEQKDDLRERILGSSKNSFHGPEINFGLRLYNIKAEVRMPFLGAKKDIPGLTGAQPFTFISFSGGFPLDLKKGSDL